MDQTYDDAFARYMENPQEEGSDLGSYDQAFAALVPKDAQSPSMLSGQYPVTQAFGNQNPDVEVMSGGVNYGTDIGTPEGTEVNLPPGKWQVVDSFNQAGGPGYIGDNTNSGYGNSVLVKNVQTGEQLRFSHLSDTPLSRGMVIEGGQSLGKTGRTGNATGPHLDLEYYDQAGNIKDVLQSPYGGYLPGIQ